MAAVLRGCSKRRAKPGLDNLGQLSGIKERGQLTQTCSESSLINEQ